MKHEIHSIEWDEKDPNKLNVLIVGKQTPEEITVYLGFKEYDEEKAEKRMNIIAQNGNTGEHYKAQPFGHPLSDD